MSLFFRSVADIYLAVIFTRSISLRGLLGDFAELHKPPQDTDKPPLIKTEAMGRERSQHTHQFLLQQPHDHEQRSRCALLKGTLTEVVKWRQSFFSLFPLTQ